MAHAPKPSIDSEMHELNAEADLLDQKTTIVPGGANGEDTKLQAHNSDPDAQAMVIESLRSQVQDLFSQVSQLNNKLVRSYDRVSDLEDDLHVTSSNLRQATLKISQLELERTQHLSALSTGLLVEKSHVTTELTRLMEKATEEAARRGQAESARAEIEKELDDLSAGLFAQANSMVAEARIAEAKSARKLEETETALRSAEEVVGALQSQMQALHSEKEQADRRVEDMRVRMGKGKWVDRSPETSRSRAPRFLSSHVPYHEFLIFVSHLRAIRPASPQPPAMSTLLPLPFLARLVAEDSDPTVRLDLAPSLNWLSRRSVLAAIHTGQLTVEPIQFTTLLEELAPPNIPASSHHTHIVCALCGMPIYSTHGDSPASTPTTPNPARSGSQSASWSTTLFKNVRSGDINLSTPFTGSNRNSFQLPINAEPPSQLYIFRLDATSSGLPVSLPMSQQAGTPARQAIYPLCTNGWCLARLRTTCSLWAFVRTSVVEKIWEEPPITMPNGTGKPSVNGHDAKHDGTNGIAGGDSKTTTIQPVPRRAKMGLGSLWGTMQRSLSGTREPEKDVVKKEDTRPKLPPRDPSRKTLPPPPPSHPTVSHTQKPSVTSVHRVPPPLKDASPAPSPASTPVPHVQAAPPPLPKRNRERSATAATPESESKSEANGAPNGVMNSAEESAPVEKEVTDVPKEQSKDTPTQDSASGPTASTDNQVNTDEAAKDEATTAITESTAPPKPELVMPQSVSRVTSNDSFSTPTEELPPPISPPEASVPLPTSQEPSPVAEPAAPAADEPTVATEVVASQEHEQDPAPASVVAHSVAHDDKPPSRTGSPAPPPLPRRAAARARPSSMVVPQSELAKRDSVDGAAPGDVGSAPVPEAVGQPDAAAPVTDAPPASTQDSVSEEAVPVTTEPEPIAEKDEVTTAEKPVTPDATDSVSVPEAPRLNGAAESKIEPAPAPATEKDSTDSTSEQMKNGAAEEQDNGQYVGEATWEERTYKELVRLREEMFWARIGAVH